MIVIKSLVRNYPKVLGMVLKNHLLVQSRVISSNFILYSKFSPDSSPIKIANEKRRKISSSSEEDENHPVTKKISTSESSKLKETTPKKSTVAENSPVKNSPKKLTSVKSKKESPKSSPPKSKTDKKEVVKKEEADSPKKHEEKETKVNVLKIQSGSISGSDYNPGQKNYHPIKDAFWKKGEK